ncbi:hypothetical protein H4S00_004734 [Coemansia sp. D1744]|nr:hypothetical protein H4S00_004734 [Coemansia sp. D1744]
MLKTQGYRGPVTVNRIPALVQIFRSSDVKWTFKLARQKLADELNDYHKKVTNVTDNLQELAAKRSYQYNLAFGTPVQAENNKVHPFE